MGRGGVPAFLPTSLEGKVGQRLLSAVSCSQDQRMDNCGGRGCGGGGLPPKSQAQLQRINGMTAAEPGPFQMGLSRLHGAMCPWSFLPGGPPQPRGRGERLPGQTRPPPAQRDGFLCVSVGNVCAPPGSLVGTVLEKTLPCFSVTHTLKTHLTREVWVFHTSSNCLLPAWWGMGVSHDSTPTVTGVSPDPTDKGLCPRRLPPLQRPTTKSKVGTHLSSLD